MYTEWSTNDYRRSNNSYGGVGYYRIIKPAQALSQDFDITVIGNDYLKWGTTPEAIWSYACQHFDLIYIKHIDNGVAASNLLAICDYYHTPVVMDLDDNFLDILPSNPAYDTYKRGSIKRYGLEATMSLCNGLTVSTAPLREKYDYLNPSIDILPNCCDVNDFKPMVKKNDGFLRIGYQGSVTHNEDLELIVEPIKAILLKYPHVRFEMLGLMNKDEFRTFASRFGDAKDRIFCQYGTPSWEGYPELLSSMGWDIGIAPLVFNQFNRCKSHIKWLEYTLTGIPTIASKSYPYEEDILGTKTIEDGKTGFLIDNNSWFTALESLVTTESLRKELADNAYKHVAANWQYKQHKDKWVHTINKHLDGIQRYN